MKGLLLSLALIITALFSCTERINTDSRVAVSNEFQKGVSFRENRNNDSAFFYFNLVANTSKDSSEIAIAYWYMAAIQSNAGDYYGSQESLLESMKYVNEQQVDDHYILSSNYSELGNTSVSLKNFDAAIRYYNLAIKFSTDSANKLIYNNNLAVAYQGLKEYNKAIEIYTSIIGQQKEINIEYARALSNLAKAKWHQDSGYFAIPELSLALMIRRNAKDNWGMNASYSHLTDYYTISKPDSALLYADSMYHNAKTIGSPDDQLEALQKIVKLGDPLRTRPYLFRFFELSDSIQTLRNTSKNQFALIRFESEKVKSENLALQKDNTEKGLQIFKQRLFVIGASFLVALSVVIGAIWYKRRKQRFILESQSAIRENQLKTSQKVHDVVANGLYRIMSSLEHEEPLKKGPLLDKIESLYEQSRDISYESVRNNDMNFSEEITELLTSFGNDRTRVLVAGNNNDLWNLIKAEVRNEVIPILQELMVNMKKHSNAQNVVIKFDKADRQVFINYKDDGVGVGPSFKFGNGMTSTENRITHIGGQIIFDSNNAGRGLYIRISIPIYETQ